ncbi:MAG: FtsX-like permease family protein [Stagnimonas sp.]|nr:FtsX-like permease family protein [Stagnimonas sp.]
MAEPELIAGALPASAPGLTRPGLAGPALSHALRSLARGWRSGRLLILALAIALAVAAVGSVGLFTERVRLALERQSGEALGADAVLSSRDPLPDALRARLGALGVRMAATTVFPSVAMAGERTSLVSVKAVETGYPLRGELRLSDLPFGPARAAGGVPAPGEAWADLRVLQELGLEPGQVLQLGRLNLVLRALIAFEPDRGGGFSDLAPRILINAAELPDSGLLSLGSRASYNLLLAGGAEDIAAAQAIELAPGQKFGTPRDARRELSSALDRAGRFLDIAGLAAALLAAAAVALTARGYGAALRDEVALLKTLGARRGFLLRALGLQLLLLGAAAGGVGALLALGGQAVIGTLLAAAMKVELPAPPLLPLLSAYLLGLLMLLGFALPPVLEATRTPPLRVLARAVTASPTRWVPVAALLTVGALLFWQTGAPELAGIVLLGALLATGALALLAWLAVRALAPLRRTGGRARHGAVSAASVGAGAPAKVALDSLLSRAIAPATFAWRFGLANVARRQAATVGQVVALGLALLALLLITVVRQDLLESWRDKLPADLPNQFLINIQSEQVEPLKAFFRERGVEDLVLWPMARGRLVALNGQAVTEESFDDPETRRWINREFNLSWTDRFGADNELLSGAWWDESARGQPWLSADDYAVKRLDLKLGDTLTLDLAGQQYTLTVKNTRKVSWDSFKPNFFLVTPPGVLDAAPRQWLTSFRLPAGERRWLLELVRAFPNVTAFDLDAAIGQVRDIVERVVRAVEFVFLFALAAGLLVLLAAIEGTRGERMRETALLRTLGARSSTLLAGLLAEYALLGLLSGLVAAAAAQGIAWALAVGVFDIPYGPRPLLWLLGALAGTALVTTLGWLSMRRVLRTPPRAVLG